jgi:hypothetical protein
MLLYGQGFVKPLNLHMVFPATKIEDAFRYIQKGQHIGKIVVSMPTGDDKLSITPVRSTLRLRSEKSYLFVGGLGGLGRAVSTWLVERGARHLVFLSRSAGTIPKSDPYIRELEAQGCAVQTISANIYNSSDLKTAIKAISAPIAGVLQASMVLEAGLPYRALQPNC